MTEKQEAILEEVKRLKAELAELREFAYERAPKIAAEEANKQIERLKTENAQLRTALQSIVDLMVSMRSLGYFTNPEWESRLFTAQLALKPKKTSDGTLRIKKGER
jgi:hypothetical protein